MPDVDEPTNYIYDPKPWNVTIPTWPTRLGKAEAFVKSHCNNAIRNSQAGRVCNKIQSFDFQVFIDQCVEDTKVKYHFLHSPPPPWMQFSSKKVHNPRPHDFIECAFL